MTAYQPGDWITFLVGKQNTEHVGLVEWHRNAERAHQLRVSYRDSRGRLTVDFVDVERVTGKTTKPGKVAYEDMSPAEQDTVRHCMRLLGPAGERAAAALEATQLRLEDVTAAIVGSPQGRADLIAYVRSNSQIGDDDDLTTPF